MQHATQDELRIRCSKTLTTFKIVKSEPSHTRVVRHHSARFEV